MKTNRIKTHLGAILTLILVSTFTATADFKVPRSIYRIDELEKAKAKAKEKEKPLVFIYTNPGIK